MAASAVPYQGPPPKGAPLVLPDGRKVCGGKRRDGFTCLKAPKPNGRCPHHGGESTGPPITTGKRSKYLPARLAERYNAALADPDLARFEEDIATVDALVCDAIAQLDAEGAPARWAKAKQLYDQALAGDTAALRELGTVLKSGIDALSAEQRLLELTEAKRKLVESEHRRAYKGETILLAREAVAFKALMIGIFREVVADETIPRPLILNHVGLRLEQALTRRSGA